MATKRENPYKELDDYFHGATKCDWDKAIDNLYLSLKYGPLRLNTLFNNSIILSNFEDNDIAVNVGRIAILNEIARDFWVKNGYDYNKDIFLYDYYINESLVCPQFKDIAYSGDRFFITNAGELYEYSDKKYSTTNNNCKKVETQVLFTNIIETSMLLTEIILSKNFYKSNF